MKSIPILSAGALALAVALVAAPVVSTAQPAPAATPVPMPKTDFSSMMFLTGTWNCTQMLRGSTRPDTSTTTIAMNGVWMVSQDTAPPFDKYRTWPINSTTYLGYDPTIKQWIQIGVDTGGGYGMQTSPGWQGNTMTWTMKNPDGSSAIDAVTKNGETETTDAQTATDPQGRVTNTTIHCTKSG